MSRTRPGASAGRLLLLGLLSAAGLFTSPRPIAIRAQAVPAAKDPMTIQAPAPARPAPRPAATSLAFEVSLDPKLDLPSPSLDGRLFIALSRASRPEPRFLIGRVGSDAITVLAHDVSDLSPGKPARLDARAITAPQASLASLPPGDYQAQAVLRVNPDSTELDAAGNLWSQPVPLSLDPARGGLSQLSLTEQAPPEQLPPDTPQVKHLKLRSELLSAFHKRPIYLRAGVILPRGFDQEPDRHYPLRIHIGGFGTRYTAVDRMMNPGASFAANWNADDTPRMILLHLDGDGPLGDPYQVDSANHGPYGQAITTELIPHVEKLFRGLGDGKSRVTDGGSTGGWVSFALQVFYPDFFNGCWSFCPDPVDFRSYQVVNIYDDQNAYVGPDGADRPSARDPATGRTRFTIRQECAVENVLGPGDSYTRSGGQWGAWNATFSPRAEDGQPVPLWNPATGQIDPEVAAAWSPYDLRRHLQKNWSDLGPRLQGKLRIWVGEADDFFLNEAVHKLDDFLTQAQPPYQGSITYGPGQGHCWLGIPEPEMMRQMAAATGAKP